jgi:hypothetical protein
MAGGKGFRPKIAMCGEFVTQCCARKSGVVYATVGHLGFVDPSAPIILVSRHADITRVFAQWRTFAERHRRAACSMTRQRRGGCAMSEGYHTPARARRIAGLSGFSTLSQSRDGPDR